MTIPALRRRCAWHLHPRPAPGLANADKAKVEGIFAAVDFDITDRLTLAGRRQQGRLLTRAAPATPGGTVLNRPSMISPRVILRWMPTDATNIWASYSEGMIAGDFNSTFINADARERAVRANPAISKLDAETLDAWEVGETGLPRRARPDQRGGVYASGQTSGAARVRTQRDLPPGRHGRRGL